MKKNSMFTNNIYHFSQKGIIDINIFRNLKKDALQELDKGISVLTLSKDTLDKGILKNKIFIRSYYPKLLEKIRKHKHSVLIGNPGIGKSTFQYYYLARLFSPEIFSDAIPKDCYGNSEAPKHLIYQGGESYWVYDIEKDKKEGRIYDIANYITEIESDTKSWLYLFDPFASRISPFYMHNIPLLATVSPDKQRYKELCKNEGVRLFMPVFTLDELKVIGKYMLESKTIPEELVDFYNEKQIKENYKKFGGIIRYVLPSTKETYLYAEESKANAIKSSNIREIIYKDDLELGQISHFIAMMEVNSDVNDNKSFYYFKTRFVSEDIKKEFKNKLDELDLRKKKEILINFMKKLHEDKSIITSAVPEIYEKFIIESICHTGISFQVEYIEFNDSKSKQIKEKQQPKILEKKSIGKAELEFIETNVDLKFVNLKNDVVYVPRNKRFPAVDFFIKQNDKLLCFQVTTSYGEKKEFNKNNYDEFLEQMNFTKSELFLIPLPNSPCRFYFKERSKLNYYIVRLNDQLDIKMSK